MSVEAKVKGFKLARTTDGQIVGTSLNHIGKDDEEGKLQIARWSGESAGYKKIALAFTAITSTLFELTGGVDFILRNNDAAKGDFLSALFILGIGGAYTAYINRRIEMYENGIRQLQYGEEIPSIKLPQPRTGGMEN